MTPPHFLYTMNAGAYVESPYMEECFPEYPENCTNPGIDILYLVRILNNVGIRVNLTKYSSEELPSALLNQSIDIMGASETLSADSDYAECCKPTTYMSVERPTYYVRTPDTSKAGFSMLSVFSWEIWTVCLVAFLLAHSFKYVANLFQPKSKTSHFWPTYILSSGLLTECLSFLILSVLLNVYANILAIGFASHSVNVQLPFTDLKSLAQLWFDGKCSISTYDYMIEEMTAVFPHADRANLSKLNQKLVKARELYPPTIVNVDDYEQFLGWIVQNKTQCLVHLDYETRRHTFSAMFNNTITAIIDNESPRKGYAYYYRKTLNQTIQSIIDLAFAAGSAADNYDKTIATMAETGILVKGHFEYRKSAVHKEGSSVQPLSVDHFNTPFFIYVTFMILSTVIIICEVLLKWKWYRNERRVSAGVTVHGGNNVYAAGNIATKQLAGNSDYAVGDVPARPQTGHGLFRDFLKPNKLEPV